MEAIKEQHRDRGGLPVAAPHRAGPALRRAAAAEGARIQRHRDRHDRARGRRQRGDLHGARTRRRCSRCPCPRRRPGTVATQRLEGPGRRAAWPASPSMLSYPEFDAVRDQARARSTACWPSRRSTRSTLGEPRATRRAVNATLASCEYFDVLRVRPAARADVHVRATATAGARRPRSCSAMRSGVPRSQRIRRSSPQRS